MTQAWERGKPLELGYVESGTLCVRTCVPLGSMDTDTDDMTRTQGRGKSLEVGYEESGKLCLCGFACVHAPGIFY